MPTVPPNQTPTDVPDWPTASEAHEQFGFNRSQLSTWSEDRCPFLDGLKLRTRERTVLMVDGRPRSVRCFDPGQLERIAAKRSSLSSAPQDDKKWVPFREVAEEFGFSRGRLYDWHADGCPYLDGVKLAARREPADIGGRVRNVWCYKRAQIEEIARQKQLAERGEYRDDQGVWLTAKEAQQRYEIWNASLGEWRNRTCPFLSRCVRSKKVRRLTAGKKRRRVWVYHEDDLRRIADAQGAPPGGVYLDGEGTWLFAGEVHKRFGLPADGLWYYRRKKYPFLLKRKLRAKRVPGGHHPRPQNANDLRWVYHEDDLKEIVARRNGGTGGTPAQERPQSLKGSNGQPTEPAVPGAPERSPAAPGGEEKPAPRRGRPPSKGTLAVYQFCHEQYVNTTAKLAVIRERARVQFGSKAPKTDGNVVEYARRYARRKGLPFTPRTLQETP